MADDTTAPPSQYDKSYFQSRYSQAAGRNSAWRSICEYLERYMPGRNVVLDVGAGYCSFINNVRAVEKHALDIFPGFAQYANADVKTHVGDARTMAMLPSKNFDVVFASNLVEHLTREDTRQFLNAVLRVLKLGGRILLVQPNFRYAFRCYFDDYTHIQIFTDTGLADLLSSSGFQIEKIEPRFLPFSFKSGLPTWSWLVRLYLALPFRPRAMQMLLVARSRDVE